MAGNRVICEKNNVDYSGIRKAMCSGARTKEELIDMVGICDDCENCETEVPKILSSVCGCEGVSLKSVVDAVNSGAKTIEAVEEATSAGISCGRCKALVSNIIELRR
jgi:bacterioferritin-associated ferredoxin